VRAALAGAHVFVLPSRPLASGDRDGLPVAIVEAMTVGVPVVSTTVSAIPEVVVDGDTGLLVPPDDPVALADALELLLTDDGLRALLAANARSVVEHYDLTECVAGLRSHFAGRAV
jgi:glycosyltransferase involved in cell wall biosynthesis